MRGLLLIVSVGGFMEGLMEKLQGVQKLSDNFSDITSKFGDYIEIFSNPEKKIPELLDLHFSARTQGSEWKFRQEILKAADREARVKFWCNWINTPVLPRLIYDTDERRYAFVYSVHWDQDSSAEDALQIDFIEPVLKLRQDVTISKHILPQQTQAWGFNPIVSVKVKNIVDTDPTNFEEETILRKKTLELPAKAQGSLNRVGNVRKFYMDRFVDVSATLVEKWEIRDDQRFRIKVLIHDSSAVEGLADIYEHIPLGTTFLSKKSIGSWSNVPERKRTHKKFFVQMAQKYLVRSQGFGIDRMTEQQLEMKKSYWMAKITEVMKDKNSMIVKTVKDMIFEQEFDAGAITAAVIEAVRITSTPVTEQQKKDSESFKALNEALQSHLPETWIRDMVKSIGIVDLIQEITGLDPSWLQSLENLKGGDIGGIIKDQAGGFLKNQLGNIDISQLGNLDLSSALSTAGGALNGLLGS